MATYPGGLRSMTSSKVRARLRDLAKPQLREALVVRRVVGKRRVRERRMVEKAAALPE